MRFWWEFDIILFVMRLGTIKSRLILMAVAFVAMVVGFSAMILNHLPSMFLAPEEDMDYAWFVPLFTVAVLWMERRRILKSLGEPSIAGAFATIPFLFIGLLGVRGLQVRFELLAFVGLLVTIPWALFGGKCAKRVLFPVACLLFCMPMASFLAIFTVPLRLLVSSVSTGVLSLFGMEIVRHGNMITLPSVIVDGKPFGVGIADPCSGLRSIVALVAVSVGYGYFAQRTWSRRAVLLVCSVPIAVLCNIVRIMSICLIARFASPSYATGQGHDFLGFIVFALGIYLTVLLSDLLNKIPYRAQSAGAEDNLSDELETSSTVTSSNGIFLGFKAIAPVALLLSVMIFQVAAPPPAVAEPPRVVFPEIREFEFEEIPPSEAELKQLVGAELGKRKYTHRSGFWFQTSKVVSGPSKSSLHRPELCLPSQGHDLGSSRAIVVGDVEWTVIPLSFKTGGGALFAYTFFNQSGYRTSSHLNRIFIDVWDRTVHGRIDRWAMLTVLVPTDDENALKFVLREMNKAVK